MAFDTYHEDTPPFAANSPAPVIVADDEFEAVSEGRIRIRIGAIIFIIMLVIFGLRFAEVALLNKADSSRFIPKALNATRADIVDRKGEILATTLRSYSLYAEPRKVWNATETADKLSQYLPQKNRQDLIDKLSSDKKFIWLERGMGPRMHQKIFDLGLPGLAFRVEPKRVYPLGNLGAHIIGFADRDLKGMAGVERAFNAELSEPNAPAKALSIDLRVQHILTDELAGGIEKFQAKSNSGVVLNIKTGEVLAMASLPNYNPNNPGAFSNAFRYNHASMSTYELGSVFKPITMAMALENNLTDLEEEFPVQEPFTIRGKTIRDDHPSKTPMAMPEILAQSSNRGTALMALRGGGDMQQAFLRDLGLMERLPLEISESARPQVQTEWQDITTVTVSYGHGISVTPLALSAAIGALLNGGNYITPTFSKRDAANLPRSRRVISPENSQLIRDLMRYVVTDGTGRNAAVEGYRVMGKTGTADKPSIGGYDEDRLVSSFVAALPYDDPTYLVMITYDEPKAVEGTYGYATAGWNAAPTARKVIERMGPALGVKRKPPSLALSPFSKEGALR